MRVGIRSIYMSICLSVMVVIGLACSGGQLDLKLVPAHKQNIENATKLNFHFSGTALKKTMIQNIDVTDGKISLESLIYNESLKKNKQLKVKVTALDDNDKVIASGATQTPLKLAAASLRVLLSLSEQFSWTTDLNSREQSKLNNYLVGHQATALPDGRVLITGGTSKLAEKTGLIIAIGQPSKKTFFYDPRTGKYSSGPDMGVARAFHSATLLSDGRVLIAGGLSSLNKSARLPSLVEMFESNGEDTFRKVSSVGNNEFKGRVFHTASRLKDDTVIFVGGLARPLDITTRAEWSGQQMLNIDIYDKTEDTVSSKLQIVPEEGRFHHQTTALDGNVFLVTGGRYVDRMANLKVRENLMIIRKKGTKWSITIGKKNSKATARFEHRAIPVLIGLKQFALIVGGRDKDNKPVSSIELWNGNAKLVTSGNPKLAEPRFGHQIILLPGEKEVMVVGGVKSTALSVGVVACEFLQLGKDSENPTVSNLPTRKLNFMESKGRYRPEVVLNTLTQRVMLFGGAFKKNNSFQGLNTSEFFMPLVRVETE